MPSFQACSSPLVDTQSMHSKSVYAKECRGVFVVSGSFGWVSCVVLLVCCVCVCVAQQGMGGFLLVGGAENGVFSEWRVVVGVVGLLSCRRLLSLNQLVQ